MTKTCILCDKGKDCEQYQKVISPACAALLGQEQEALRRYTAQKCKDYVRTPQRFFFYSDPAHTPYTKEDYVSDR